MKKEENICYVQIIDDELKEIIEIITELNEGEKNGQYKNEVLNMVFKSDKNNKSKNEKEELLDELIKDFGFDKETVDKLMKDSPDLDLNDIITNLLVNDKKEENVQQDINTDEINTNIGMNNIQTTNLFMPTFTLFGNNNAQMNNNNNFSGLFGNSIFTNIPINSRFYNPNQNTGINLPNEIRNPIFMNNNNNNEQNKKKKNKKSKKENEETEEDLINKKIKDEEDKISGKKKKPKKKKKNEINTYEEEEDEKE